VHPPLLGALRPSPGSTGHGAARSHGRRSGAAVGRRLRHRRCRSWTDRVGLAWWRRPLRSNDGLGVRADRGHYRLARAVDRGISAPRSYPQGTVICPMGAGRWPVHWGWWGSSTRTGYAVLHGIVRPTAPVAWETFRTMQRVVSILGIWPRPRTVTMAGRPTIVTPRCRPT